MIHLAIGLPCSLTRAPQVCLAAVLIALSCGCEPDAGTDSAADAGGDYANPTCEVGTLDDDGRFSAWKDGDKAELVEGYQGYLLLLGWIHVSDGDMPDKPNVLIEIDREGGKTSRTTYVHSGQRLCDKKHPTTERLEMWMVPPDPSAFIGRKGSVTVTIKGRDGGCSAKVAVQFVDDVPCKHFDDGTIFCPGDKPVGAAP